MLDSQVWLARAQGGSGAWGHVLRAAGATVVELAVSTIGPPPDGVEWAAAIATLPSHAWIALTSANAVAAMAGVMRPAGLRVGVVGPATALAAEGAGWTPDVVAERADGLGLAQTILAAPGPHGPVFWPHGNLAAADLPRALAAAGVAVTAPIAYTTCPADGLTARLAGVLTGGPPDWLALGSGSAFQHVCAAWPADDDLKRVRLAAIGAKTAQAITGAGYAVSATADQPTPEALLAAIVACS